MASERLGPLGKEETPDFKADPAPTATLFHHEQLEVYRASLQLIKWFVTLPHLENLPTRHRRQMDEALTGIPLHIAEGNGRYSELDQRRFLDLAASSAVKTAAYLDLGLEKQVLQQADCIAAKKLLERITAMLSRM